MILFNKFDGLQSPLSRRGEDETSSYITRHAIVYLNGDEVKLT